MASHGLGAGTAADRADDVAGDPETAPPSYRLTLDDALELAAGALRSEQFEPAETLLRHILRADPASVDATHLLAILHHKTERSAAAIELLQHAVRLAPARPDLRSNLGNMLLQSDRLREAAQAFRAAIRLDPGGANAHNNYGVCQRQLGFRRGAEASYRRAIACDPRHGDACNNLGRLLLSQGRFEEAIRCHAQAMELTPHSPDSRRFIVGAYVAAGDLDRARAIAADWQRDEPESATARHMLAAISGQDVPARASDDFVEIAFDRFAASFDSKLAKLEYRAPELVAEAVGSICGVSKRDLAVLDAGCGTGLCGPLLQPFAARLDGVDLSSKMLGKAQHRGCYDSLVKAELTTYMLDHPSAFDLIVSADTLCYFGDLHAVIRAAAGALRPGGILVFSVEAALEPSGVVLNPHGRYSHGRQHVVDALEGAEVQIEAITDAILRKESLRPVEGFVVTARKPAAGFQTSARADPSAASRAYLVRK